MFLPNEIINLILSYREAHPVSLLMKDAYISYTLYQWFPDCGFNTHMFKIIKEKRIHKKYVVRFRVLKENLQNLDFIQTDKEIIIMKQYCDELYKIGYTFADRLDWRID